MVLKNYLNSENFGTSYHSGLRYSIAILTSQKATNSHCEANFEVNFFIFSVSSGSA
jgi:hypothetical protein